MQSCDLWTQSPASPGLQPLPSTLDKVHMFCPRTFAMRPPLPGLSSPRGLRGSLFALILTPRLPPLGLARVLHGRWCADAVPTTWQVTCHMPLFSACCLAVWWPARAGSQVFSPPPSLGDSERGEGPQGRTVAYSASFHCVHFQTSTTGTGKLLK